MVKDVPALICNACDEVECTLAYLSEIHAIMKGLFAGLLLAKVLEAGRIAFRPQRAESMG